jgi:hypothetical protein
MIKKYKLSLKRLNWELEERESGYTKLYLLDGGKRKMHLDAIDLESCFSYIWKYYNSREMKHIKFEDLERIEDEKV